jgi:hypothetical protein
MSFNSVTSSYTGDALRKYILQALIGGETLSTNGISVETGIKLRRVIKKLAAENVVQPHNCDFSPTSGVTITEGKLEPQKFKVNESICFDDIYELWDADTMTAGVNNENIPQDLVDGLIEAYLGQVAKEVEEAIWQGDVTGSTGGIKDLIDGYEKIMEISGKKVDGTTLTVANILTEMQKAYAVLPAGVRRKPKGELVWFMSHEGYALYEMNLQAQGVNTSADGGRMALYGIEIVPIGGFSDANNVVLGARDNFYVGTDLMADFNEIKLLDQRETVGDDKVNFVLKAKFDVTIAYPNEAVYYRIP